jgi:hypothetical protein
VITKIGSTFFWFLLVTGSWKSAKWCFIISMKFPIDRIPSCLLFEFRDFGRIMTVDHWTKSQNRDSRVFSSSPWNFWFIEHNHALYWKFETLAGLRSRPQVQMTMGPIQKNIPGAETYRMSSHMFNSDSRNSSYAQKSVFSLERVLVKARILDS